MEEGRSQKGDGITLSQFFAENEMVELFMLYQKSTGKTLCLLRT